MKLFPAYKPEQCVSTDETRYNIQFPHLDAAAKVVVATDGRVLVAVPADVEPGDLSGPLGKLALARARGAEDDAEPSGDLRFPDWSNVIPPHKEGDAGTAGRRGVEPNRGREQAVIRAEIPGTDAALVLDNPALESAKVAAWLRAVARKIGRELRPKRRRGPQKKLPPPPVREDRGARWAAIKDAVARRVDRERQGRCEWACEQRAEDPHHILGGSGRRKAMEAPETVAGVCRSCHRAFERGDLETLLRALKWARGHGFQVAAKGILRRMEKADEAALASRRANGGGAR